MADQDRERWKKLVADFEASDLTQREFASERGISFSNLRNWIGGVEASSPGDLDVLYWVNERAFPPALRIKGIAYMPDLARHYVVRSRLDGLEWGTGDGSFVKALGDDWYIYYVQQR